MTRNTPNAYWTTFLNPNNADQVLNTKQAGQGLWGGGGQVTFGRWWCPCCSNPCSCGPQYAYGLQFTYWQIGDMSGSASVFNAGGNPRHADGPSDRHAAEDPGAELATIGTSGLTGPTAKLSGGRIVF